MGPMDDHLHGRRGTVLPVMPPLRPGVGLTVHPHVVAWWEAGR